MSRRLSNLTTGTVVLEQHVLLYIFVCFSVGLTCLGVGLSLARRPDARLVRAFLVIYGALSTMVLSGLLLAYVDTLPSAPAPSTRIALEYVQGILGFYGVMFALPFFVHRVFGVESRRRDRIIGAITIVAVLVQHVTEYGVGGVWDPRGDAFEDALFVGVMAYALVVATTRLRSPWIDRSLATRVWILVVLGLPGLWIDLFLNDATPLRIYPIWYCLAGATVTWTLARRGSTPAAVPAKEWGLSSRETEVWDLVRRGLSNKDIGVRLHISPNTVKTHLRAVFEKTGVRSRVELIALGAHTVNVSQRGDSTA